MPDTAVISGGSRGLGLALVRSCLQDGLSVASFARGSSDATGELCRDYPDRFMFGAVDATDREGLKQFLTAAVAKLGTPTLLVNNAAIGQDHLLAHLPESEIARLIAINIEAPIVLTRLVVRQMLRDGVKGRIVNISSICATQGFPGLAVYSASKAALEAFTRSLAHEVGPRGIMVNAIAPGFFSSEMSAVLTADQIESVRRRAATERLTEVADVVAAFRFLISSATNLTGQVIRVDGGA